MSTEKYVNLTGVSRATAYRELTQLTELGLLARSGQGRGTRYALEVAFGKTRSAMAELPPIIAFT